MPNHRRAIHRNEAVTGALEVEHNPSDTAIRNLSVALQHGSRAVHLSQCSQAGIIEVLAKDTPVSSDNALSAIK